MSTQEFKIEQQDDVIHHAKTHKFVVWCRYPGFNWYIAGIIEWRGEIFGYHLCCMMNSYELPVLKEVTQLIQDLNDGAYNKHIEIDTNPF